MSDLNYTPKDRLASEYYDGYQSGYTTGFETGKAAGIRELLDALEAVSDDALPSYQLEAINRIFADYRARYPATEPAAKGDGDNGGE